MKIDYFVDWHIFICTAGWQSWEIMKKFVERSWWILVPEQVRDSLSYNIRYRVKSQASVISAQIRKQLDEHPRHS